MGPTDDVVSFSQRVTRSTFIDPRFGREKVFAKGFGPLPALVGNNRVYREWGVLVSY